MYIIRWLSDEGDLGDASVVAPLTLALALALTFGDRLERAGFAGGESGLTGMLTHFWHSTSLPVKVTRSPEGNGCLSFRIVRKQK